MHGTRQRLAVVREEDRELDLVGERGGSARCRVGQSERQDAAVGHVGAARKPTRRDGDETAFDAHAPIHWRARRHRIALTVDGAVLRIAEDHQLRYGGWASTGIRTPGCTLWRVARVDAGRYRGEAGRPVNVPAGVHCGCSPSRVRDEHRQAVAASGEPTAECQRTPGHPRRHCPANDAIRVGALATTWRAETATFSAAHTDRAARGARLSDCERRVDSDLAGAGDGLAGGIANADGEVEDTRGGAGAVHCPVGRK